MLRFEYKKDGVEDISVVFRWSVSRLFLNSMNQINPENSIGHYRCMEVLDGVLIVKKSAKSLILTNLREK